MDEFLKLSGSLKAVMFAIGLAPSALLGVIGFVFRERLKHRLAKSLNAHTEQLKVDAQREIEAYKVTLIASIERQRAHAELKKLLAVKHATLEYEAIAELHKAVGVATALVLARATSRLPSAWTDGGRIVAYRDVQPARDAFALASEQARLFLSDAMSSVCSQLSSDLSRIAGESILNAREGLQNLSSIRLALEMIVGDDGGHGPD